jgi:hypothetical protein
MQLARLRPAPRLGLASLVVAGLVLSTAAGSSATTPEQIDHARTRALAWLISHQESDGSWRSGGGADVTATALAVEAMQNAGFSRYPGGSYPYAAALAWLGNVEAASVDSLARAVLALRRAGMDVTRSVERLLAWRNAALGWGAYGGFGTSFPDTALAVSAIRQSGWPHSDAELRAGLCAIATSQRRDPTHAGSWSYVPPVASAPPPTTGGAVVPTTANLLELEAAATARGWTSIPCGPDYSIATSVDSAVSWLIGARRNADDGFGDAGVSTAMETALAYEVLRRKRPEDAVTAAALDYLLAAQRPSDASWNGDPLVTALVLKVLPPPATPLDDTDGDGIPDAIEAVLGTSPSAADSRWLARGSPGPGALATLTVRTTGTGAGIVTSADGGIACGGSCSHTYALGTTVMLSALPASDAVFTGWSGDADCRSGGIALAANRSCIAVFSAVPPSTATLTVSRTGAAAGTITSLPPGIDCGADCEGSYPIGTVVSLTAVPETGAIARWSGGLDCADGTVVMDGPKRCTAAFDPQHRGLLLGLGPGALTAGWLELVQPQPPHQTFVWIQAGWPAYNSTVGETRPAFCDVDGDGVKELVVGFGPGGGGGWLQVFKESSAGWSHWQWLQIGFNAAQGETFPACGDLDGDGRDDIVVGLGAGAEGWLKVFTYTGGAFGAMPGTPTANGWIQVTWAGYNAATHPAVGDVTGDGRPEIVVGLGPDAGGWLQVFGDRSTGFAPIPGTPSPNGWLRAWSGANGETRPALCDVDGDGTREIVTGFGAGSGGWLQIFGHSPAGFAPFAGAVTEGAVGWLKVTWIGTSSGETFPACGDFDGDGRDEIVVGLGVGGGGWTQLLDDATAQFAPLTGPSSPNGWVQLHWNQYDTTPGYGLVRPAVLR